jgi:hypothetical protein
MADIMYTLEYVGDKFKRAQSIVKIGGKGDRIRFVTTEKTKAALDKEGNEIALQRDPKFPDLPLVGFPKDRYFVPLEDEAPKWFTVRGGGKRLAFHLDCGEFGIPEKTVKGKKVKVGPPKFTKFKTGSLPFPV